MVLSRKCFFDGGNPESVNIFSNYEIAACAIFRVFSSKGTFKCDKIKPIESPCSR